VARHAVAAAIALLCSPALAASAAPASAPLTLQQRVLRPNEFKGFTPTGAHPVIKGIGMWAGGYLPIAALRKNGFVAGVREQLHSRTLNADALSVAAQFKTAKGARAEVPAELSYFRTRIGAYKPFNVPGIPGAHGYASTGGGATGYNVLFSDGPFQYLVGTGFSSSAKKAPSKAELIAVAAKLYHRVRGHPAR
jgi:hypothetical protein